MTNIILKNTLDLAYFSDYTQFMINHSLNTISIWKYECFTVKVEMSIAWCNWAFMNDAHLVFVPVALCF